MDANPQPHEQAEIDARTRLRIISVDLNEATAELYKARHDVLYRRLRVLPARRQMPAWAAALIIGGIGAAVGAIPALIIRGDNVLFVFSAVCAAYTILAPATLLLLADRDGEDDLNRLAIREAALRQAIGHRDEMQKRVATLHEQHRQARIDLRSGKDQKPGDQTLGGPAGGSDD